MNYESPVFVSIVLYTIYVLLAVAAGVTLWSAVKGVRREMLNMKRAMGIVLLLAATMGLGWMTADTRPLTVNGKPYTDVFWLRASDMLITTTAVLTTVLMLAILYSLLTRRNRHV